MPHPGAFRPLKVSSDFRDFVLDQLGRIEGLRSRRMFGGVGLYSGELFFGLLAADELFLRVDEHNRAAYEAAGSEPFRPFADQAVSMSYWRVPLEVLEDPEELVTWARQALRVAASAPVKRRKTQRSLRKGP
jgi:DNA transformation protein and related proteins